MICKCRVFKRTRAHLFAHSQWFQIFLSNTDNFIFPQSAGTVEYTDTASLHRDKTHNESPEYDIKQSDGEVSLMLELWRMGSTPSLPSLPSLLFPGVVAPDRVLSMELNCALLLNRIV